MVSSVCPSSSSVRLRRFTCRSFTVLKRLLVAPTPAGAVGSRSGSLESRTLLYGVSLSGDSGAQVTNTDRIDNCSVTQISHGGFHSFSGSKQRSDTRCARTVVHVGRVANK